MRRTQEAAALSCCISKTVSGFWNGSGLLKTAAQSEDERKSRVKRVNFSKFVERFRTTAHEQGQEGSGHNRRTQLYPDISGDKGRLAVWALVTSRVGSLGGNCAAVA